MADCQIDAETAAVDDNAGQVQPRRPDSPAADGAGRKPPSRACPSKAEALLVWPEAEPGDGTVNVWVVSLTAHPHAAQLDALTRLNELLGGLE
jgi:hypothetical protein